MKLHKSLATATLMALCLTLVACADIMKWTKEVGMPVAVTVAKGLLTTAAANYAPAYKDGLSTLISSLQGGTPPSNSALAEAATRLLDAEVPKAIAVEVALLKEIHEGGQVFHEVIEDGDTLYSRSGPEDSDRFTLFLRPDGDCYLYVIWIDGSGWVQPVFPGPLSSVQNPVPGGTELTIPRRSEAFALDENKGVENVFVLASRERRFDIEQLLHQFQGWTRMANPARKRVLEPALITHGVARSQEGRPIPVRTRGGMATITPTVFLSQVGETDLVVTRWFRHD